MWAHGIAKFTGIQTINKDGRSEEYPDVAVRRERDIACPGGTDQPDPEVHIGGFHGHPSFPIWAAAPGKSRRPRSPKPSWTWRPMLIEVQAARAAEPGFAYPPDHRMAAGI